MIHLIDQDGHTVKMTKEEIALSLKLMGNPEGTYLFVHRDETEKMSSVPGVVLAIRPANYPKYSWLQMFLKRRKKSKLLDQNVLVEFAGEKGIVEQKASPVWLRLKHKKRELIYVH